MSPSRIARVQERRERQRLIYSAIGIVAITAFVLLFGLKILVGFSLLVDRIRGGSPPTQTQQILVPPILDPQPEATNSANMTITGSGQTGFTLVLYLNGKELKKLTVPDTGTFSVSAKLDDGTNTISAKLVDDRGNSSNLSNIVTVIVKKSAPALELTEPVDGAKISGDNNSVLVSGKTEEGVSVTVNGRLTIVASDGSFHLKVTLSEGENTLTVIATDTAGNQTLAERKVNYQK